MATTGGPFDSRPVAFGTSVSPALLQYSCVAGAFATQLFARSAFVDPTDAVFKIKERATNVLHVRDASDLLVVKLTIQEGGCVGWHTHPGPAIVAIQAGSLGVIHADDCEIRLYEPGQAFIDPGHGSVHDGFNVGSGEMIAYVTFLGIPAGQGPTIPTPSPGC